MLVVLCHAFVRYEGRISAERSLGDICMMVREPRLGGDGSVVIYDVCKGVQPGNWMPAGSVMERRPEGFFFWNEKTEETLEVYVKEIFSEATQIATTPTTLTKLDSERNFSNRIKHSIQMLGEGLIVLGREYRTTAGPVDIMCVDAVGTPIVCEVKRRQINPAAAWQTKRYLEAIEARSALALQDPEHHHVPWDPNKPASGWLIAPGLANAARAIIKDDNRLAYVRVKFEDLPESPEEIEERRLAEESGAKSQTPARRRSPGKTPKKP